MGLELNDKTQTIVRYRLTTHPTVAGSPQELEAQVVGESADGPLWTPIFMSAGLKGSTVMWERVDHSPRDISREKEARARRLRISVDAADNQAALMDMFTRFVQVLETHEGDLFEKLEEGLRAANVNVDVSETESPPESEKGPDSAD